MASSSSRKRKTVASKKSALFVDPPSASDEESQENKTKTGDLKKKSPLKPHSHNSLSKRHAESKTEANEDGSAMAMAEKKFPFNRLWSEDDEIHLLQGAIEYQSRFGKDVSTHYQNFHDFVKGSLHLTATKAQLADKFRKLKKKYNNGDVPSSSKPHELKCFNLFQKLSTSCPPEMEKSEAPASVEACKTATYDKDKEELFKGIRAYHMSNNSLVPESLKNNLSLLATSELQELHNKWKELRVAEMELYLERIDTLRHETRMVLNAIKSNKD